MNDPRFSSPMLSRRTLLRGTAGIALGVGAAGFLSACSGSDAPSTEPSASGSPKAGGRLLVGTTGGSQDTLDPNLSVSTNASWYRINQLYGALLAYTTTADGPVSGTTNQLADSVESPDPSRWIVRLKQGLTFHDGKPITADDVVFSIQRALEPTNQLLTLMQHIDGKGLRKVDDLTVEIPLQKPDSLARDWLPQIFILPKNFDPSSPIGSGPYKYKSFRPGGNSTFERFADFVTPGHVDEIVTYSFSDETARINALLSGQLNYAPDLPRSQAAVVSQNSALKLTELSVGQMHIAGMNVVNPPFSNADARMAFKYLIDREAIINQVYNGYGTPSNDLFMPQDPAFLDLPVREHDPDKAKSLLASAGFGSQTFTLSTSPTFPDIVEMAGALAQQAQDAGVDVKVEKLEPSVYYGPDYATRSFATANWAGSPISYLVRFALLSGSPYNQTAWKDPQFDAAFNAATAEADEQKRKQHLQDLQQIFYDRGTFCTPAFLKQVDGMASGVEGTSLNTGSPTPDWTSIWMA